METGPLALGQISEEGGPVGVPSTVPGWDSWCWSKERVPILRALRALSYGDSGPRVSAPTRCEKGLLARELWALEVTESRGMGGMGRQRDFLAFWEAAPQFCMWRGL